MGRAPIIPRAAHHVGAHWRALSEIRGTGERFVPALTEPLPPAARRWINHAVAEGTPMAAAARLEMSGQIRLGSWRPFTAVQLLAPTSDSCGLRPLGSARYQCRGTTASPTVVARCVGG